jgi:hypothetical protein
MLRLGMAYFLLQNGMEPNKNTRKSNIFMKEENNIHIFVLNSKVLNNMYVCYMYFKI